MYVMTPEILKLLRIVFDEVVAELPPEQQTQDHKAAIAARMLSLAATGEKSAETLRAVATRVGYETAAI